MTMNPTPIKNPFPNRWITCWRSTCCGSTAASRSTGSGSSRSIPKWRTNSASTSRTSTRSATAPGRQDRTRQRRPPPGRRSGGRSAAGIRQLRPAGEVGRRRHGRGLPGPASRDGTDGRDQDHPSEAAGLAARRRAFSAGGEGGSAPDAREYREAYDAGKWRGSTSWPWSRSTATTWRRWSADRARCRWSRPWITSCRRPAACTTPTSTASSIAT